MNPVIAVPTPSYNASIDDLLPSEGAEQVDGVETIADTANPFAASPIAPKKSKGRVNGTLGYVLLFAAIASMVAAIVCFVQRKREQDASNGLKGAELAAAQASVRQKTNIVIVTASTSLVLYLLWVILGI